MFKHLVIPRMHLKSLDFCGLNLLKVWIILVKFLIWKSLVKVLKSIFTRFLA